MLPNWDENRRFLFLECKRSVLGGVLIADIERKITGTPRVGCKPIQEESTKPQL